MEGFCGSMYISFHLYVIVLHYRITLWDGIRKVLNRDKSAQICNA